MGFLRRNSQEKPLEKQQEEKQEKLPDKKERKSAKRDNKRKHKTEKAGTVKKKQKDAGSGAAHKKKKGNTGSVLSAEQKRKIAREVRKKSKNRTISAQKTLPFTTILEDGVCVINDHHFSKAMAFSDINYQLADGFYKEDLFNGWCNFYNYFDPNVDIQVVSAVQRVDLDTIEQDVLIPVRNESVREITEDFNSIIHDKLVAGNNDYVRQKYIVFGVDAQNVKAARQKLTQIEQDLQELLQRIDVKTRPLNGYEWLKVLRDMLNPEDFSEFLFNYDLVTRTGLSTKDFICPNSFDFRKGNYFKTGDYFGCCLHIQVLTSKLDEKFISQLLSVDNNMVIAIHAKSFDQESAVKYLKRKLTDVEASKVKEQKKAVRDGYDMDILPPDIVTYNEDINRTLTNVESGEDRYFTTTVLITVFTKSRQKMDRIIDQLKGIARGCSCDLKNMDFRQEQGFMSCLPLGVNLTKVSRNFTTRAVAGFIPFTTVELLQRTGDQIYSGINAISGNLITLDRKTLDNPNGLILGIPGGGKSVSAKKEIENVWLATEDDIFICDPESEYRPLVESLHGQVIEISPTSHDYMNPMDISIDSDENAEDQVKLKIDFILSLMEIVIGGRHGLSPVQASIIDVAASNVYRRFLDDPMPEKMPTLEDLYDEINSIDTEEAPNVAAAMARFVHGSSNLFNHRTNVDVNNRLVCFDIRSLGNQLKKIGMMTVQDHVWNRVVDNRKKNKYTRYFMDEFHLMLNDPMTAAHTVEIYKRFRKYGGIPTGITQNVTDLLLSKQVSNIFKNSEYIRLLKQRGEDKRILQEELGLSGEELKFVIGQPAGHGLIIFGTTVVPFKDDIPKDSLLYKNVTTKLGEAQQ